MRFGLVHRVMTDALAALGVLAVVSTASLSPWTNLVLVVGLAVAIAIPEAWQGRPALRHFATIAPLRSFSCQGARLLAGTSPARRRRRVRGASSRSYASRRGAAPRTTSKSSSWRSCTSSPERSSAAGSPTASASSGSSSSRPGALVLSHLRREVEGNYRQGARDRTGLPVDVPRILRSRRVVGRGFPGDDLPALGPDPALHDGALRPVSARRAVAAPPQPPARGADDRLLRARRSRRRRRPARRPHDRPALRGEGPGRPAADAADAPPARDGVRRVRRARLGSARSATCVRPTTDSTATTSIRCSAAPTRRDRVVSFDLEPIDPPVVFLPPRAVALAREAAESDPARRAADVPAGPGGRDALRRLGRARAPVRRVPRGRQRGARRAADRRPIGPATWRCPSDLPARVADLAHRWTDDLPTPAGEGARHRRAPAPRVHVRPHVALAGQAAAGRSLPLRVAARALRVLLDRDGDDAARGGHPVAQRDRLRRRDVESIRAVLRRSRRATRTRGSRRTSTTRRTPAGGRSTRRPPAARSRSSRPAASTTTCATSWRRSRSAGTRTSSATTCESRCSIFDELSRRYERLALEGRRRHGTARPLTRGPVVAGGSLLLLARRRTSCWKRRARRRRERGADGRRNERTRATRDGGCALSRAWRTRSSARASAARPSIPPLRHAEELTVAKPPPRRRGARADERLSRDALRRRQP